MNYREKVIRLIASLDEAQLEYLHDLVVKELGEGVDSRSGGKPAADSHVQDELMFSRFLSDWAHLHSNLHTVGEILGCKETFMEILYSEPVNHECVKKHMKASNALASAMQDIVYLMHYHEGHRMEFDIEDGFLFECGSYVMSRGFFKSS